jgi:hypothetical protein
VTLDAAQIAEAREQIIAGAKVLKLQKAKDLAANGLHLA